jgi:serine/threonine protein kinase/tetratricopeptide (TPR) repeat protein
MRAAICRWEAEAMGLSRLNEEAIFHAARKIDIPDARLAYLDHACGDDRGLRGRLDALLLLYQQEESFLECPAVARAAHSNPDASSAHEGPGTIIGLYTLLEQIGEGGMGIVYRAKQTQPVRRTVALKIIKPGMDTRQVIARFEAERQALAMMDHPNIARVIDAGTTESGRPYFVMELIGGIPITDYCDGEKLPIRDRLELFIQVCQAVQHAHQKGIIHRDLKPTNVLITMLDGIAVPKVIDFGVAKAIGQQLTENTLFTGLAQLVGTPLYMSPEQAGLSGHDQDTRSDIYSLGVLLYELLTGTTPFEPAALRTAAVDEIQRIIREQDPPRPSARLSALGDTVTTVSAKRGIDPRKLTVTLRGDLDWIVMKCLEKDRARRYETASGLAVDIQRYLTDEPVEACPPSAWYRFGKFARRNRASLGTAGLIMAALLTATAISLWQAQEAERARRSADRLLESEKQARGEAEIQRRRAQTSFDRAINRMSGLHTKLYSGVSSDVPPETRRALADEIIGFFQEIADREVDNKIARLERAQSYLHLGAIYGREGKPVQLVAAYEQAIGILEGLTAEFPLEKAHWQELGVAHDVLASHLSHAGQKIDAMGEWREAAVAYRLAAKVDPSDPRGYPMLNSVLCWCRVGAALARAERHAEAEAAYREALVGFEVDSDTVRDGGYRSLQQNTFAWTLLTCPVPGLRDPARAVGIARKAVELALKEGGDATACWNTLGVALYRTGDWEAATEAMLKSEAAGSGPYFAYNGFFLAMACWQLDKRDKARTWYDRAIESIHKYQLKDDELNQFRAEAAALLGLNGLPADVFARPTLAR